MKIEAAIHYLRPNASWAIRGGAYSGLEWIDQSQSKPTEAEVAAAMLLPEPVAVPQEVPTWALREVCMIRGHAEAIVAAIDALPEPPREIAKNRWNHKGTISRGSSMISAMQAILGWTSTYVDELFIAADVLDKS
jgi:hypothetical protein